MTEEEFEEDFVEEVLRTLHIEPLDFERDEILALCPGHEERTGRADSNPSWWINATTGMHLCFSCRFSGSLAYLVAFRLGMRSKWSGDIVDIEAGRRWLDSRTTVNFEAILRKLEQAKNTSVHSDKVIPMTEARLAVFDDPPEWALKERGLSPESVQHYGIRWDPAEEAWVTPIRDPDTKKLWGWQAKSQTTRFFRNRPANVRKSKTLFGWDTYEGGTLIVVEAPLDCARMRTVGVGHGVATMGSFISKEQVDLLTMADKVIFAFDNPRLDKAGRIASNEMLKASIDRRFECWFFNYDDTDAKDPGDMSGTEIRTGVTTARHCVLGRQAISA